MSSDRISQFDDATVNKRGAPTMSRSRGQLAGAYAPGAFFTFEGGLGACIAQPDYLAGANAANITSTVKSQIVMRFEDAVKSWYDTAINCRRNDIAKPPVLPAQCVSQSLINSSYTGLRNIDSAHFVFVSPDHMGYAPAPLTFVCNHCGLYRGFDSVDDFAKRKAAALNVKCTKASGNCHWRQLDVIFVHWSGRWEPVRPGRWNWINNKLQEPYDRCPQCAQQEFRLETRHSEAAIGGWHFVCTSCGAADLNGWHKHDPDTLDIVRGDFLKLIAVARMEPVSYRASAAFYPQSDQFILFADKQEGLLSLLDPTRQSELKNFLAERFGFGRSRPTMIEIEIILKQSEKGAAAFAEYKAKKDMLESDTFKPPLAPPFDALADMLKNDMGKMEASWFKEGLVKETNMLPTPLVVAVDARKSDFDARYDPFRLVVEHQALVENHLNAPREANGRSPFVHFDRLDKDLAPKDPAQQVQQETDTRAAFGRLGIGTMGLIRNFKLCRFTYGYTRVSAVPVVEKHYIKMPVRLNLFPQVKMEQGASRTPIYVITQENEAFYVRLDAEMVYRWLSQLALTDSFAWTKASGVPLGALVLERTQPMQRFLTTIHRDSPPFAYYYVYTLLHTYAHVIMRAVSELSGLDAGSLGEYLFPADLAFVVYRSGTTLDLGNLSSLWRNANARFLHHVMEPTTLACNSGSLCSERGGACPDCILIPETSCIAQNQLLSRSVLRGGLRPREDMGKDRIPGYLDVVNAPVVP